MIQVLLAFTLIYLVFFILLSLGWRSIKPTHSTSDDCGITVIVPVRNEANGIEHLLTCLAYQDYHRDRFEVIVVNDFSEDQTVAIVERLVKKFQIDLKVISLEDPQKSGKKYAITKGVEVAKFDFIITTDGDCRMGPKWLASYAPSFRNGKLFIAGPVALKGDGIFSTLQQLEFSGLIGFGAVTIKSKTPSMCNGANLGFSKTAFNEVEGYKGNYDIPSGDDEFLLYDIQEKHPTQTTFLKSKTALVLTSTHTSLKGFINQRIRWTSKWKYHKNFKLRLFAVLFFAHYLVYLLGLGFVVFNQWPVYIFLMVFGIHLLSLAIYILPVQRFLGHRNGLFSLLFLQIIYPIHVLFMGVNSIFGRYTWKGRKY